MVGPRGGELTKLVADHVLRDEHGDELAAVVDRKGVPAPFLDTRDRAREAVFVTAPVPSCDVLLFVTTPSERLALQTLAEALGLVADWSKAARNHAQLGDYFDLGEVGKHHVVAVPTKAGALAAGGSAAKAVLFQTVTGARALVAVGMAFGITSTVQQLGDVLVSRRVFPYDIREVHDAETGYLSNYRKTTSLKAHGGLVSMFERASKRIQYPFRVSFGTLLSGGARISSRRFRDEIARTVASNPAHGMPIGGDMEAAGLLSVAHKWVVVKAISDFAEGTMSTTDDAERTRACQNAVRFALTALQNDAFDDRGRE